VADRLRQATVEGRLVAEELEQRLEALFVARTYGELDAVVADLPAPSPRRNAPRGRARPSPQPAFGHWLVPAIAIAIVLPIIVAVVVAAAVFLLTGAVTVWLVWLLAGWWFFGHRRRAYGPHRLQGPRRRVDWTRF
jgi:Flp pilus assembly protein TadB